MGEISELERLKAQAYELEATNKSVSIVTDYVGIFGVKAGYLLSQCRYYERRFAEENRLSSFLLEDGTRKLFWWHTDPQWIKELQVGKKELKNAKDKLIKEGVLKTFRPSPNSPTFYRIDRIRLAEIYVEFANRNKILPSISEGAETEGSERDTSRVPKGVSGGYPNGTTPESNVQTDLQSNNLFTNVNKFNLQNSSNSPSVDFVNPSSSKPTAKETKPYRSKKASKAEKPKAWEIDGVDKYARTDDEFFNICRFVSGFCLAKNTPHLRSQMTYSEKKRTEAFAGKLQTSGKTNAQLEAFAAWYATTSGGKLRQMEDTRTVDFVIEKWSLFVEAQKIPQAARNKNSGANAFYDDTYDPARHFTPAETTYESNAEAICIYDMEDDRYEQFRASFLETYPHRIQEVEAYERRVSQ